MRKEIALYLKIDKPVIDKLFDLGLIDVSNVNAYLIYKEFLEMKKQQPNTSNHAIHNELSAKHGVSPSSIYKWCQVFS